RVEVWMNSMIAASWWWSAVVPNVPAVAWPARTTSIGRSLWPPAETMCSASGLMRMTSDARAVRIRVTTAAMAAGARAGTRGREVLGDLVDEDEVRGQAGADQGVHRSHVGGGQGLDPRQRGARGCKGVVSHVAARRSAGIIGLVCEKPYPGGGVP